LLALLRRAIGKRVRRIKWPTSRAFSAEMATDMFGVGIYLWRAVVSTLFWILAILLCALFFTVSRSGDQVLRVGFFWIPSVRFLAAGMIIASFGAYEFIFILIRSIDLSRDRAKRQ
jgi:hypothetical protein